MIRSVTTGCSPAARTRSARSGVGGVHRPDVEHAAAAPGAVVHADRRGVHRDPDGGQQPVGHAEHRRAAEDAGEADHRRRRVRAAPARIPGTARIGPMETTGLLGATRIRSAAAIASATPGRAGRPRCRPDVTASAAGWARSRTQYSWKCTARRPPGACVVGDGDVGLDPVVGHRQQPQARVAGQPARGQRRGHLRQRVAGVQQLGADQVGAEVAVAEGEPGRLGGVRGELRHRPPALVLPAPAALGRRRRRPGCTSRCPGPDRSAGRAG